MRRILTGLLAAVLCVSLCGCEKPEPTEPKCDHQLSNWMVKSKATCIKEGREERICNICYETESRPIPMIAHNLDKYNVCRKCYFVEFDPDADVVELGILSSRYYGPAALANTAWDVKVWDGKVYCGAGDYGENTGKVPIFSYDIATNRWEFRGEMPDQAVHSFEEIDGTLFAPGIDPTGSWDTGNYYYLQDGKWKTMRTIPNGVHNFDMIEFDGKIFAGMGTEDVDDTVAVSTDKGQSWTYVPLYKDGKRFDTSDYKWSRTYEFTQYNNQLYALISFQLGFGSSYMVFRYEDGKMIWLSDRVTKLLGGSSVSRKYWGGEFEFDGACYLTLGSLYAIRDFSDQDSYEKIEMPNDERVADAFLKDGVIYVLTFQQDKKTKEYTITIYKSTTGKTGSFETVQSFTYLVPPCSFDTDGTYFYVGMGYSTTQQTKSGTILRVKPAS